MVVYPVAVEVLWVQPRQDRDAMGEVVVVAADQLGRHRALTVVLRVHALSDKLTRGN